LLPIVVLQTHLTTSGVDFYTINPNGNVPAIVDEKHPGVVLNQNAATLQYIADLATGPVKVAPAVGTYERYVLQGVLSWISSELHAATGPLWNPANAPDAIAFARSRLDAKLKHLNDVLIGDKKFLVGDYFTVADSYLYIVLSWTGYLQIDLTPFPKVQAYVEGIKNLEAVKAAFARIETNPATTI
jgi:glutathione S-transferase